VSNSETAKLIVPAGGVPDHFNSGDFCPVLRVAPFLKQRRSPFISKSPVKVNSPDAGGAAVSAVPDASGVEELPPSDPLAPPVEPPPVPPLLALPPDPPASLPPEPLPVEPPEAPLLPPLAGAEPPEPAALPPVLLGLEPPVPLLPPVAELLPPVPGRSLSTGSLAGAQPTETSNPTARIERAAMPMCVFMESLSAE
jgi:hypothetical protein